VARLGYRVALIDADIGLRNLDLLLGLENRVMFTAMEVLDGECRLEQARAWAQRAPARCVCHRTRGGSQRGFRRHGWLRVRRRAGCGAAGGCAQRSAAPLAGAQCCARRARARAVACGQPARRAGSLPAPAPRVAVVRPPPARRGAGRAPRPHSSGVALRDAVTLTPTI
jgi:hypothetical protein